MVRVWVRVVVVVQVRVLSASTCLLLYIPQLRSPHFTRGQWSNDTIRTVNS